jgi:hypothetical protein
MPKGILFWMIYIVFVVVFGLIGYPDCNEGRWRPWGGMTIILILLAIVGWALFGAPVQ